MSLLARNRLFLIVGAAFTTLFVATVIPSLVSDYRGNVIAAFGDGFVNPMSSGYALDTISVWIVLAIWVAYERSTRGVRGGWVALVLGLIPGVVVGLIYYLLLRERSAGTGTAAATS